MHGFQLILEWYIYDKTLVRLNLSIYTEMTPALDFSASDTVVTE